MAKIQSTLNNFSVLDTIKQTISGFEASCKFKLILDKNGVIRPEINSCPKCNSKTLHNGYNLSSNKKLSQFGFLSKNGKVCCSNCNWSLSVPTKIFQDWISKFDDFILGTALSLRSKGMSNPKITDHISEMSIINVSSEYIRKKVSEAIDFIDKPNPQYVPSEVIIHDEQFLRIKGIEMKRITQLDANNPNVYYDKPHSDRSQKTIEQVCIKLKNMVGQVRAVVMDGYTGAQKAFMSIFSTILIQFCLFHFAKNVKDAYKESVGYGKGRSTLPLQHLIGFFSILNIFFDHEREIYQFRRLQNKMNEHILRINKDKFVSLVKKQEWIQDLNQQYDKKALKFLREIKKARRRIKGIKLKLRTEEEAKMLFEIAKLENVFPKKVEKQLKRLEKNWLNFTHCMRDPTIPPTSNKVEQLYSLTLNWIDKRTLQSEDEFYTKQKFSLFRRYGLTFIKEGLMSKFLETTFAMFLIFGIT